MIENKKFHLEYYDQNDERFQNAIEDSDELFVKNYQTDVIIYENINGTTASTEPKLDVVKQDSIRMNQPLKFGGLSGYTLYQAGYQENEFTNMTFNLIDTNNNDQSLGTVTIDLTLPEDIYILDRGVSVEISQYYLEYEFVDGEPRFVSKHPKNPAFVFKVDDPEAGDSEFSFVGIWKNIDASGENKYKLEINDFETHFVSGLTFVTVK